MKKYFLCGIAGSGMLPLAGFLRREGHLVSGSDRSFDLHTNADLFSWLNQQGIDIFHQNGTGVKPDTDAVITSGAVESEIPDLQQARNLNIPIIRRPEMLSNILNKSNGIAVGGTSGKSTTSAMIAHIMKETGMDPSFLNGAPYLSPDGESISFLSGKSGFCVAEADESDGSLSLYHPTVSVVTNISLDHKPIDELEPLFAEFVRNASVGAVLNADSPYSEKLKKEASYYADFSTKQEAVVRAFDIRQTKDGMACNINHIAELRLPLFGLHNVENALAAIATMEMIGTDYKTSAEALSTFKGVKRRLELKGSKKGIRVYDDFAHNPDKIKASLRTLHSLLDNDENRLWVIFQPHGFSPTRLMKDEYIKTFSEELRKQDVLLMPEIFYQGGTVQKDISSADIVKAVRKHHSGAYFNKDRNDFLSPLFKKVSEGDIIVVMGARDRSLTDFAEEILKHLF